MALRHFPATVAWDPATRDPVVDGVAVQLWTAAVGGSQVQPLSSTGTPIELVTEGDTVPDFWLEDRDYIYIFAGVARFQQWADDFGAATMAAAQAAADLAASFNSRLVSLETALAGGVGGGGSQLGLVEDVFTVVAEDGGTYVGANGAVITRANFMAAVPAGHRLVIKDHPSWATSTVRPILPAAWWAQAVLANPQAEFESPRTPVSA